ncbi:MAG TPA: ATP-binding protein [Anaerolineae bacterium]|nr:ATP-binding protein [Anaerolineae bacterium]
MALSQKGLGRVLDEAPVTGLHRRSIRSVRLPKLSSLRAKLIVPYVVLTLLIAMVGTYVVTRLVTSSIRERFVNQLYETSRVAADGIVRRERTNLADLRLMAYTEGVHQAMSDRDAAGLQDHLWPLVLNNNVEAVTAIDLNGHEIITLARDPVSGQYLFSTGADFSEVGLVRNVLDGQVDSAGDKFVELLETERGLYLFTSAPVRDSTDTLVGALMVGTRLQTLLVELKSQALADIVVLDRHGNLMATTLVQPDEGYSALEMTPQAVADVDPSQTRDVDLYGRNFQMVYAPLEVREQTLGLLGVVLPSSYLVTTEATSRDTFSLLFSLVTLVVVLLGYGLSQSIARPILRLQAILQAVAAGDLNQRTGLNRSDEIGALATAFDSMTLRLRERTEEAARLYAESVQRNRELADINARLQETQQHLIQSEKLAAIGQLTAGIVHDVKNPLMVIKGLAETLQEDTDLDPETQEQLDVIRDSAAQANQIVTDLLKFARQSMLEMSQQDLASTVESALRLTAYLVQRAGVEVVADLPAQPVMVIYDAQQIEQVLINLIQNAIQAMPDGGTLRVSLRQAGEAVAIAVQDTGVGIPPEKLTRVFDPFFTTKPDGEGTGLGLSVSYGIVSHHKGRIDVESTVGQGTTFTILLPTRQPLAAS